jgi:hypothetical protein
MEIYGASNGYGASNLVDKYFSFKPHVWYYRGYATVNMSIIDESLVFRLNKDF